MKVLCIKPPIVEGANTKGCPRPQVGDEDIVTKEHTVNGVLYFSLQRFGDKIGYNAKCFGVPSDLDETELVTEEFEEKYCIPANK
jgi:hypothetical protein